MTLLLFRLKYKTRMHSSRMRTARSLTVCRGLLSGWGVCSRGRGCAGGCARGEVCEGVPEGVCQRGGVPEGGVPGGVPEGVWSWGGVVSQHALRQTPPPVNRMTNSSKNITLATTSLRPVINVNFTRNRKVAAKFTNFSVPNQWRIQIFLKWLPAYKQFAKY